MTFWFKCVFEIILAENNNCVDSSYQCVGISNLQSVVGCNHWGLIIDRCDVDVNGTRQAVFPGFCLVCHNGEVVSQGVTAVVDVGNVLPFHLKTDVVWKMEQTNPMKW